MKKITICILLLITIMGIIGCNNKITDDSSNLSEENLNKINNNELDSTNSQKKELPTKSENIRYDSIDEYYAQFPDDGKSLYDIKLPERIIYAEIEDKKYPLEKKYGRIPHDFIPYDNDAFFIEQSIYFSLTNEEKKIITETFNTALKEMLWYKSDGEPDNFLNKHFTTSGAFATPNTIHPRIENREDLLNFGLKIPLRFQYDWFRTGQIAYKYRFYRDDRLSPRPLAQRISDRDFTSFTHHGVDLISLFISFDQVKDFIKEGKKIPEDLTIQRSVEYGFFMKGFDNIISKGEADELIDNHFPGLHASERAKPIFFIINSKLTPFLTFTDLDTDLSITTYIEETCGGQLGDIELTEEKIAELKNTIIKHDYCGLNLISSEITCYEQWNDCLDRVIYSS